MKKIIKEEKEKVERKGEMVEREVRRKLERLFIRKRKKTEEEKRKNRVKEN